MDGDERLADDAPVVVGMACRFAGGDGLEQFWQRLLSGRSALGTTDRWPGENAYVGGFLTGHCEFDTRYFRISPNEARCMDPQQRLLLQSVQHAVDDSHLTPEDLRELRCGVFTTGLPGDYRTVVAQRAEVAFSTHSFLGNAPSTLSGRISYFYNITGPSITLDSACSSSLTALHQALLSIRSGQCRAAIVGAASVFSTPEVLHFAQRSRMSSPTGTCLPFTDAANGFVPAEGTASIIVMRYDEARARGLRLHGAVVAAGTNHNGTTNGLMAPSGHAQAELIADLYEREGIDPARIAYVEAHGTGTPLGDPLELDGLRSAFRRAGGDGCHLGAVKSLIGHTLVCSGLAGVIKALLAFRHETIPPAVSTDEAISYLDLAPFRVNREPLPWPADKPLCAVSAFGFTGSNGHVVLRKLPPGDGHVERHPGRALPFCLSAESQESLTALVDRLHALVHTLSDEQLWDLSQLLLRRPCYAHRHVVVVGEPARLRDALAQFRSGAAPEPGHLDDELHDLVELWQACDTHALRRHLDAPADLAPIALPGYPFEKRRYWVYEDEPPEAPTAADAAGPVKRLCADLSALLGFGEGEDRVQPHSTIASLGLDSLSAVQLLSPYQASGSPIKTHDLFRYETIADLAAAIGGHTPRRERTDDVSRLRDTGLRWHEYGGDGPPTVLLPPMNCDHRAWAQQIPRLVRDGRKVCVPVYPGHGDEPFDPDGFSFEHLANEVARFLRGQVADLVGWSLGGCIAMLTALRYPQRVNSLALISCAPRYGADVFERTLDLQHELRTHSGLLEVIFDRGGNPADSFTAGASMEVLRDYYAALSIFDIVGELPDIAAPCLVVRGREDCVVDARTTALLTAIPRARIRELTDHGHYAPLTAGRAVNEELTAFWADRP
jgi:3-oxoacyl-(acyl-carrier-protein) synthase/pimeloyl-ACP methyl ester carboxylesterase